MRLAVHCVGFMASALLVLCAADNASNGKLPATFQNAVTPLLTNTCNGCHNDQLASGGLDLTPFRTPASIAKYRPGWEAIVQKLRASEMPPKGIPRPPQSRIDALVRYVEGEFDRADRLAKPDPGRVIARRLNRYEYSNTVRDLLGVEFHAEKDFPTDDSSYGFDNIASALSVSPVLTERYLAAAEKIASRAIGADPLPAPRTFEAIGSNQTLRRLNGSTVDVDYRVDYDGDYLIRLHLLGQRPADAKPAEGIGIFVDGKLLKTAPFENKASETETELRQYLTAGQHAIRARLMNDEYGNGLARPNFTDPKKNRYVETMTFVGPFASQMEKPGRKRILACDPQSGPACTGKIVATLAHRAYRRPVTNEEVAALVKFVTLAQSRGLSTEQGIELAIEAILVSPDFLFRIERDTNRTGAASINRVSGVELASRLSYFLWSSMPDDELLALAESGKLHAPAVLDAQVKRMLADPKSGALADNFGGQWLEFRNLDIATPDTRKYADWGPDLRNAMKTETRMFFEYILHENRPISDFLNARYTFLNDVLARHYGIAGVGGSDFRRVELATEERGGLLGQAGILTVSSYPTRTSVVLRGKYVLENILGTPPPPPPPDVPALDETRVGTSASLRQQMEIHRANPSCASCHAKMDVLGFGLENYDGVGKWRTMDGKFPVDPSGTLPNGKSFSTPAGMRTVLLAELPQFAHCLTEKMLTYSLGRGLEPYDRRTVTQIERSVTASDYRFQTLIYEIVRSLPFQMRRGEVPEENVSTKTKELARK
jgi:mono/diheme cytochrome c family protein